MEAFISMITAYGCNFVIRSWGACWGGLVAINQNNALFSLLGTAFGGDGRTTFGLPDLRSRSPLGYGAGPGLSTFTIGQKAGVEYVTLNALNLPSHDHTVNITGATVASTTELPVSTDTATLQNPDGAYLATTTGLVKDYVATMSTPPGSMGPIGIPAQSVQVNGATGYTGSNQQFLVQSPIQAVNYQICMFGIYPSRN